MNKEELISAVAIKTSLTKQDTRKALNALCQTISETLAKGEEIQLIGFGKFEVRGRAARTGCNPITGKKIKIPAFEFPAFKPGKEFRKAVK
ncbi:HU family DNA-binding protein [Priestia megaterium]|uniref:HU family DNA-binding protein n=1 Tax=Priestia megaterium TaxID=1404 RepID=UPI0005C43BA9|nr:HU family DNA-binding protein [Priestia megaterium]